MFKLKPNVIIVAALLCISAFSGVAAADPLTQFQDKLMQYQGKVVYVDFWASWCTPCRRSFPWMNEMKRTHQGEGFEVISINLDSEASAAQTFLNENPADFDVIYDPTGILAKKYQVKGMPSSFILDRRSSVTSVHVGFTDKKKEMYEQEIMQLLSDKTN